MATLPKNKVGNAEYVILTERGRFDAADWSGALQAAGAAIANGWGEDSYDDEDRAVTTVTLHEWNGDAYVPAAHVAVTQEPLE